MKALDAAIGFNWGSTFEDRWEELRPYKKKYGNTRVPTKFDKKLALFCSKSLQRHPDRNNCTKKYSAKQVRALDELGFEWNPSRNKRLDHFEDYVEQLRAHKEKYGNFKLSATKHDKWLVLFCIDVRQRHPDKNNNNSKKLTNA